MRGRRPISGFDMKKPAADFSARVNQLISMMPLCR